jgi:hypothetical protein
MISENKLIKTHILGVFEMNQSYKSHFSKDLIMLAQNQSPTLQKIIEMKAADVENIESIKDPIYLTNACSVLATEFTRNIDNEEITFGSDSGRMQFYWLIQILVDVAIDGLFEQLGFSKAQTSQAF